MPYEVYTTLQQAVYTMLYSMHYSVVYTVLCAQQCTNVYCVSMIIAQLQVYTCVHV
jgi:hypothetical protein